MIDIKLNSERNDLELVNGDLVLIDGIESLIQGLRIRSAIISGEWFLDNRIGVIQFVDKPDPDELDDRIRKEIMKEDGVTSITNYTSEFSAETRIHEVFFEVNTVYGEATLNEQIKV